MRRELGLPEYEPREEELKDSDLDWTDKGIALRVIECEYRNFVWYCSPYEIHEAWEDFSHSVSHYADSDVADIIRSACYEFRRQDPEPYETSYPGYDAMTSRALREQYLLHYWLRRCECPKGSRHVTDPSWVDEEAALHRQGECRFEGPKIPWPWSTSPAEEK